MQDALRLLAQMNRASSDKPMKLSMGTQTEFQLRADAEPFAPTLPLATPPVPAGQASRSASAEPVKDNFTKPTAATFDDFLLDKQRLASKKKMKKQVYSRFTQGDDYVPDYYKHFRYKSEADREFQQKWDNLSEQGRADLIDELLEDDYGWDNEEDVEDGG